MLGLLIPSCKSTNGSTLSARDKIEQMDEQQFSNLILATHIAGSTAGLELGKNLSSARKAKLVDQITSLMKVLKSDQITSGSVTQYLLSELSKDLTVQQQNYLTLAVLTLNMAVGDISIGIDGNLTDREKLLLDTLLASVAAGLGDGL